MIDLLHTTPVTIRVEHHASPALDRMTGVYRLTMVGLGRAEPGARYECAILGEDGYVMLLGAYMSDRGRPYYELDGLAD